MNSYLDWPFIQYIFMDLLAMCIFVVYHYNYRVEKEKTRIHNLYVAAYNAEATGDLKMEKDFDIGPIYRSIIWMSLGVIVLQTVNIFSRWLWIIQSPYRKLFMGGEFSNDSMLWILRNVPLEIAGIYFCVASVIWFIGRPQTRKWPNAD